jgi:hypothetical protein
MNLDVNILGWIVLIAMFFVGRFSGISSEAKRWVDSAVNSTYVTVKGLVFEVKFVGEEE